jgi:hypothetical protein
MCDQPKKNENLTCEVCGRFGAFEIGDRVLCETCYVNSGSCCPEFGADDLWAKNENSEKCAAERGHPARN